MKLATYPRYAGAVKTIDGVRVESVPHGEPADIVFQKFRKDYKARDSRPYKVGQRGFGSLITAVQFLRKQQEK